MPNLTEAESAAVNAVVKSMSMVRRASERNLMRLGNLNRAQFEVLLKLYDEGGQRMYQLADHLGLSRSTLTYHVGVLLKEGFVSREGGTAQRRAVTISITETGREFVDRTRSEHAKLLKEHFLKQFNSAELEIITAGCRRVIESFKETKDH